MAKRDKISLVQALRNRHFHLDLPAGRGGALEIDGLVAPAA